LKITGWIKSQIRGNVIRATIIFILLICVNFAYDFATLTVF